MKLPYKVGSLYRLNTDIFSVPINRKHSPLYDSIKVGSIFLCVKLDFYDPDALYPISRNIMLWNEKLYQMSTAEANWFVEIK